MISVIYLKIFIYVLYFKKYFFLIIIFIFKKARDRISTYDCFNHQVKIENVAAPQLPMKYPRVFQISRKSILHRKTKEIEEEVNGKISMKSQ